MVGPTGHDTTSRPPTVVDGLGTGGDSQVAGLTGELNAVCRILSPPGLDWDCMLWEGAGKARLSNPWAGGVLPV